MAIEKSCSSKGGGLSREGRVQTVKTSPPTFVIVSFPCPFKAVTKSFNNTSALSIIFVMVLCVRGSLQFRGLHLVVLLAILSQLLSRRLVIALLILFSLGLVFMRASTQFAYCAPSRNSFMCVIAQRRRGHSQTNFCECVWQN